MNPFGKFGTIEPAFAVCHCLKRQRFDSTKFSEGFPFKKNCVTWTLGPGLWGWGGEGLGWALAGDWARGQQRAFKFLNIFNLENRPANKVLKVFDVFKTLRVFKNL